MSDVRQIGFMSACETLIMEKNKSPSLCVGWMEQGGSMAEEIKYSNREEEKQSSPSAEIRPRRERWAMRLGRERSPQEP
jgi:hypothetical protein